MLKKRIIAAVIGLAFVVAAVGASAGVGDWLADTAYYDGQAIAANSGGGC